MDELTNSPSRRHAMIAENLLPVCRDEAKGRQKDHGGTAPGKSLVVKVPQVKARDAAGKAYTPLRLAMGWPMPPTRWRATSRNGEGMGMGLVRTENKTRVPAGCSVSLQVPRSSLPAVTGPRTMFRNH